MAWQQPKTNWDTHPKAIEPADLNRIEGNIEAVREQSDMALRLETVSSFPAHTLGRVIYHTGNKRAYVSDGAQWIPIGVEGDAVAANVLSGKKFSSLAAGVGITGTMPNRGAVTITPGTANQTILQGYHNGSGYVKGDTDLVPSNIKEDVNIFNVVGTLKEGAVIKSVQSGLTTITITGRSVDINAVSLDKSFLIFSTSGGGGDPREHAVHGSLSYYASENSSDRLRFENSYDTSPRDILISWMVVEFEKGVSVQHGKYNMPSDSEEETISISPVDVNKSFVIASSSGGGLTDPRDKVAVDISSSTTLRFRQASIGNSTNIHWQVVTFL